MPYVLLFLIALGYAPFLYLHFELMWSQPQYQYFPFVIGALAWLAYSRTSPNPQPPAPSSKLTLLGIGVSWLVLAAATFMFSPWLAMLSLILLFGVGIWHVSRTHTITNPWGLWLISFLLLPLPLGLDRKLVQALQGMSSRVSSYMLDALGVMHSMEGNVLRSVNKEFFVDEACSGIISVMSIIACALIYSVWKNRPLVHLLLSVVIATLWAMALNIARITLIAVFYIQWGIDLSAGWQHETLGLVLFLAAFCGVVGTDFLLAECLAPIDWRTLSESPTRLVRWFNWLVGAGRELRGASQDGE
ncbi:exosortase/archaeosortase family protein [Bythopirellula polymerisocia]|uniref:Transmembrane exosortase n=1 Tax=Bythopirellula polymerisocia TaxID=2528003 RepID=A0A5C6CQQ5_9BACT|nr:exosortase/archaeosortase family protein [Bythopirellula polymerisocia]TWU25791.1 Transmembrane exosortase [Bythopirellula polymerisocia]